MPGPDLDIKVVGYDDPAAAALIAALQQEYVVRYGGHDATTVSPAEFAPPLGLFLVGCADGLPVACGGWRAHDGPEPDFNIGDAEVKRMYVAPSARGHGYARVILAELERTAAAAGRLRIVLETGTLQPEAMALYAKSGYLPVHNFSKYRNSPTSRCFGKPI